MKECTDHVTSWHELMSQASTARQVWSKDSACCLQSRAGCRALLGHMAGIQEEAASPISCDVDQEKKRKGRVFLRTASITNETEPDLCVKLHYE